MKLKGTKLELSAEMRERLRPELLCFRKLTATCSSLGLQVPRQDEGE